MNSISFQTHSIEGLEDQIFSAQRKNFQTTLAIVFGSVDCDLQALPDLFNHHKIDFIACSTAGEIRDEHIYEKGLTGLLLDINPDYYKINVEENIEEDCFQSGKKVGIAAKEFCDFPALLTFFGMTANAEKLIAGMTSVVKEKVNIFGGMAADDFKMEKTYCITNAGIFTDANVSLIFNQDKVELVGRAISGWVPIGMMNTITKAAGNIIYEINGKPALQAFESYFGSFGENAQDTQVISVGVAQYPLQIIRNGNTILRAALKTNNHDHSILMAGPVHTGDEFRFSIAPGFEVVEDTIEGFQEYHKSQPTADALILISCKARHLSLGPFVEDEVKGIQNIWKKPLVGFFSYGEVGLGLTDDCNFYNETCSLVLIREKM